MSASLISMLIIVGVVLAVLGVLVVGVLSMWKKVGQDKALVITGLKKRVISGGGGLVIPLLERGETISLEAINIDLNIQGKDTDGIDVVVEALTVVKVKNEKESILAAMEQFNAGDVKKTVDNMKTISRDVLQGKLREIASSMYIQDLFKNKNQFASKVQEIAGQELGSMGIEFKSFTINKISDPAGYLDSLGKKQVAEIKRDATIAEANATKEKEIAVAEAQKDTLIKTAEAEKEAKIQLANIMREQAEAKAEADIKIAEAEKNKTLRILENTKATQQEQARTDVAYEIQSNILKQETIKTDMEAQVTQENKNVELTTARFAVEKTKEEKQTEVAKQQALRKAEELKATMQAEATATAEKTKTEADALLYKRTKEAEAKKVEEVRQAEAVAEKVRLEAIASAEQTKIKSIADSEATKARGMAEAETTAAIGKAKAEAVRAEGMAEADVIGAKAQAEAEGLMKKAEAMKQYGEAAMAEMVINVLPDVIGKVTEAMAQPIGQIGNITVLDNGSGGGGTSKVTDISTKLLTELPSVVKGLTGIDMVSLLGKYAGKLENKLDTREVTEE